MDENQIISIVADSYNTIAPAYEKYFRNERNASKFDDLLEKFVSYLPENAKILDAGVGGGIPTSKYLIKADMNVTGVDQSQTMLDIAKINVPEATLRNLDITQIEKNFDKHTFDGIVSVFTLFHIPRALHGEIFKQFSSILKKGGVLMINSGASNSEGFSDFFGKPMFWSSYSPEKTLNLVKNAGFDILYESTLIRGGETQYWIFAKKQ
jgi:cyclopropane fatty-acyl-phospholipid synthase-like methyltransferase